jgi:hypothetical protein
LPLSSPVLGVSGWNGKGREGHTVGTNAKIDLLSKAIGLECLSDTKDGVWRPLRNISPGRSRTHHDP